MISINLSRAFFQASIEADGNIYGGREMTELERRERERKESRHLSGMDKITHDVSQRWTVKSRSQDN